MAEWATPPKGTAVAPTRNDAQNEGNEVEKVAEQQDGLAPRTDAEAPQPGGDFSRSAPSVSESLLSQRSVGLEAADQPIRQVGDATGDVRDDRRRRTVRERARRAVDDGLAGPLVKLQRHGTHGR